jgi:hypothetical protein
MLLPSSLRMTHRPLSNKIELRWETCIEELVACALKYSLFDARISASLTLWRHDSSFLIEETGVVDPVHIYSRETPPWHSMLEGGCLRQPFKNLKIASPWLVLSHCLNPVRLGSMKAQLNTPYPLDPFDVYKAATYYCF